MASDWAVASYTLRDSYWEDWLPCPVMPELYLISSIGRVRRRSTGTILRARLDRGGYQQVNFVTLGSARDRKFVTKRIARLVLRAFVGEPESNEWECDHIDRNTINDRIENLRWLHYSENLAHRARYMTKYEPRIVRREY